MEQTNKIRQPATIPFDHKYAYEIIRLAVRDSGILELKTNIETLADYMENVDKKHKTWFCKEFTTWLLMCSSDIGHPNNMEHNVIVVPPEKSPTLLLLSSVTITTKTKLLINGLKILAQKCEEFVEPIEPIITKAEIFATLDAAQKTFRLLNIIAPKKPLHILTFNCSHVIRNSEYGIPNEGSHGMVLLYHPREVDVFNRVFIFAHELGHALHLALTGDIKIMPEYFDEFNDNLGASFPSLEAKQEAFADVVAHAILGSPGSGLEKYLPPVLSKDMVALFVKYVKGLTANSFAK